MITGKYDVISDIHGHAEELRRLLREMDYREDDGVSRHRDRRQARSGEPMRRIKISLELLLSRSVVNRDHPA
jgi:hypothetical protein